MQYIIGAFYWVLPVWDVDVTESDAWTNDVQPARYAGQNAERKDLWQFIEGGNSDNRDEPWGCRWVGEQIKYEGQS